METESKTFRVWMPKLAETEDGKLKAVAYGCLNVLSADGNTLVFDDLKADKYDGDIPEYDEDADIPALIFAKDPGNGRYIFRGVFMLDRSESSYLHYVFKRVATRIELIGWPVEKIKY